MNSQHDVVARREFSTSSSCPPPLPCKTSCLSLQHVFYHATQVWREIVCADRPRSGHGASERRFGCKESLESTSNFLGTVTHLTTDAVGSGGWIYPIRGILYFVSHPSLYRSISDVLIKCILGSVGVVVGMFVLTYLPQVAILAVVSGPLAFIGCVCTAHMTLKVLIPYI